MSEKSNAQRVNYYSSRFFKIRKILAIVFTIAVLIIISLVVFLNKKQTSFIKENQSLSSLINTSGRQRMLSQNISKTSLKLVFNVNDQRDNRLVLDSLSNLFQESHNYLLSANLLLGDTKLDSLFTIAVPHYSQINSSSKQIIQDSTHTDELNDLLSAEYSFLPVMDLITKRYEKLGSGALNEINNNLELSNYLLALIVIIAVGIVFYLTLRIIKSYTIALGDQATILQSLGDRLNTFFESTSDLIYELDEHSRYTYVNKTVEKLLGYSLEELRKKSCWDFVPDEYLDTTRNYYIDHVKTMKKSSYYEFPIKDLNGNWIWLGQSVDYRYEGNKAIKAYAIAKDITNQKNIATKRKKYGEGLRLLNELGAKTSKNHIELISEGLRLCTDFLRLDVGIVSEVEKETYTILDFYPANAGLERGQLFELGNTYCDIALKANKTIAIDEMSTSKYSAHPCYDNFKLESYIGASYSVKGKVRGTVNFTSNNPRNKKFTEYDIDFVTLVARWVGTIVENHEASKAIEKKQSILQAFVSSAPAAIAMFDTNVHYLAASKKWYDDPSIEGEIIGKSHYDVFPEIGEEWKDVHQRAIGGETLKFDEDPFPRTDGSIEWIKWEVGPWYDASGKIGGLIMFTEDVTRQRKQREKLMIANEEQDNLVAIIAHDLKAPFSQILGLSDLIQGVDKDTETVKEMIKKVSGTSLNMINDLVELKYLEKSGLNIELTEFDLRLFYETKMKLFLERAQNKKITLTGNVSLAKDRIVGDEDSIGRIVDNLLSNAIKFSPKGEEVIFNLSGTYDGIILSIEDSGEGFTKEDKEKVFQKFQKLSTRPTGGESSSGLGLSIVNALVDKLNGKVTLESEKGEGAKFTVVLPINP